MAHDEPPDLGRRVCKLELPGGSIPFVLFAPGRRETRPVIDLARGRNSIQFVLPRGKELLGQKLWLRAEEIRGPRVLNYTITAER